LYLVNVDKEQEVLTTLNAAVESLGIRAGSMTLVGAVQQCTVSVMAKDNALDDHLRTYDQPFELTGTGEVIDGKVHVHVVLGGEDVVVAGHLHSATVRDFFLRAYITPFD
jgi:predicted DNA-binding protein with PD1-like motif